MRSSRTERGICFSPDSRALASLDPAYPSPEQLSRDLGVPAVEVLDSVTSTLDVAHERAAAGAASGTLIVAEEQTAGRGRQGRSWTSQPGAGIWLTLIERPTDRAALDVLSLRVGIRMVEALEPLVGEPLRLKWPNDVYLRGKKLAGVLVEARWRANEPDWVAIGVGLNIRVPSDQPRAVGLHPLVSRNDALYAIVPAIRKAAAATGSLTEEECEAFGERDYARGHRITSPVEGMVQGINASGSLVVLTATGVATVQAGSLVLSGEQ